MWNHARICSWNQPVLSNMGKVSWSRKQQGLKPMTSKLQVRRVTHWITSSMLTMTHWVCLWYKTVGNYTLECFVEMCPITWEAAGLVLLRDVYWLPGITLISILYHGLYLLSILIKITWTHCTIGLVLQSLKISFIKLY